MSPSLSIERSKLLPVAPSILWATFLTGFIAGPWALPGYLFGTDWPGPRRFDFPGGLSSPAPVEVALAALGRLVGGEVTGKIFVFGVLFVAGALAYNALPTGGFLARAAGSTIYLVNPFVYGRLHYGQLFLLAAYALFPWVATQIRDLVQAPGLRAAIWVGVATALLGAFSIHVVLVALALGIVVLAVEIAGVSGKVDYLTRSCPWLAVAFGVGVLASGYWVIPLLLGIGPEAAVIAQTGPGDIRAYAAVGDPALGLVPNLLGLYGFWAENSGRFTSMKHFVPGWPLVLLALLVVGALGTVSGLRGQSRTLRRWLIGLVAGGSLALVLEMGVSHPATAGLVEWINAHLSLYRGMRDSGKWAVLIAFVYSQVVGIGAVAVLETLEARVQQQVRREWLGAVMAAALLALPLYYGNGLLFGAHGQIQPSSYPAGWYSADRMLAEDPHPELTLFLPWHEYMSYGFIRNQNRIIAPPAPAFFSAPVLVSANPEVPGIAPPLDAVQQAVVSLIQQRENGNWAQVLAQHRVKYILLAHELDWASYDYLDKQEGITKVGDWGSIVLYRNSDIT